MTTAIAEPIKKLVPAPPIPVDAASPTVNIPVSRIVPSPWNRKEEVTDDLVDSVRKNGVVQNVVLRPHKATEEDVALYSMKSDPFGVGDSIFQLVAGERRWGAAKKAGKAYVIAAVRHLSDIEAMDLQIDENENRKNLSAMHRAEAYDRLRMLYQEAHAKDKDYTEAKAIEAVAASRKCSSRTVYDVISLKKLTQNAQHALRNGEMENSHGTAMSGRSPEEQEKLLLWLRQQTHHSKGDVPSVRRLKLEIRNMDIEAEEKKRQQKLFKEPQPGTVVGAAIPGAKSILPEYHAAREAAPQTSAPETRTVRAGLAGTREVAVAPRVECDGKTIDLFPGKLPGSVQVALVKAYSRGPHAGPLTTAHFLKDGRVQLAIGLTGKPFYLTAAELQNVLTTGIPYAPPQTVAKEPICIHSRKICRECKFGDYKSLPPDPLAKPLSEAQIKKNKEKVERESLALKRQQDAFEREQRIKKVHRGLFFNALAKKAQINSRLLTHVVPNMIFEVWENEVPIEAFAEQTLGWPAPKDGHAYTYSEVKSHATKHTRKFTGGLLAAMVLTLYLNDAESLNLAKYMGVDPKKLLKQAADVVKEEESKAKRSKA